MIWQETQMTTTQQKHGDKESIFPVLWYTLQGKYSHQHPCSYFPFTFQTPFFFVPLSFRHSSQQRCSPTSPDYTVARGSSFLGAGLRCISQGSLLARSFSLFRSLCMAVLPLSISAVFPSLVSSTGKSALHHLPQVTAKDIKQASV